MNDVATYALAEQIPTMNDAEFATKVMKCCSGDVKREAAVMSSPDLLVDTSTSSLSTDHNRTELFTENEQ